MAIGSGIAIKKVRDSNLELYRIIVMLLIVAHHYVVNSGLLDVMLQNTPPLSAKSLYIYWLGMWGKTGINCFVLITGYFMCASSITVRKFLKLLLEIEFYNIAIYAVFCMAGYSGFTIKDALLVLLPVRFVGDNFTGCFMLFFLCIPFLNILVRNLSKRQHILLIALCLMIYTLFGTWPGTRVSMNYVSWFCVLFIIASYIRIHGIQLKDRHIGWGWLTTLMIVLSMASVPATIYANEIFHRSMFPYRWVSDSNTFFALATGVCSFMYFKNLKVKYNPFINAVGACTFGVLLIHANSDTMRQWLWKDVLDNVGFYSSDFIFMHAILSVFTVFVVCAAIDYIRMNTVEKWAFRYIDRILKRNPFPENGFESVCRKNIG